MWYNVCSGIFLCLFSQENILLSDAPKLKAIPRKKPMRKLKDEQKHWGDQQKMEAVEAYIMLGGNVMQTAVALQIPRITLQQWTKTEWWKELYDEVKQQDNIVLSLRLQKIVARSLDLVEDRLEKGDIFYDQKAGMVVRKEVSLRDAHQVFKDSFLVKEQIERPNTVSLDTESIGDKLANLAAQFEKLADTQKAKPKVEVTDVIFIEEKALALHDERPENGQDGSGL